MCAHIFTISIRVHVQELLNIIICISLLQNVKLINLAVSLGGVESLICHPASTTHCEAYVPTAMREAAGVTDTMIRLR